MKILQQFRSLLSKTVAALKRFFSPPPAAPNEPELRTPETTPDAAPAQAPEDLHPDRPPTDFSQLPQPVLAIDLGASYTKVSLRRRIEAGRPFTEESRQLTIDGAALIPTVVVCDPAGHYHFGNVAANIKAAAGWQVWYNWKKDLLDSDQAAASSAIVATNFFAWLREMLQPLLPDLHQTRVRIALPAFADFYGNARTLRECLARAGWNPNLINPIREPQANTIGLTSRGRNHVNWPAQSATPHLNYGRMFGHLGIIERATNDYVNKARTSKFLKGMVADIGAYTTDIAPLIIDLTAELSEYGTGIQALKPSSIRLGISAELDQPLFQAILPDSHPDRAQLSFLEFELVKQALYFGKTYTTASGQDLGTTEHQQVVAHHLDRFADSLWEILSPAAHEHHPEWIAFTGGGSCITPLAQRIRRRVEAAGFRVATLGDAPSSHNAPASAAPTFAPWSETGTELKRLATALGCTCPILDIPSASPYQDQRDWAADQEAEPREIPPRNISCHCGGLNPDCCDCHGSGSIPASEEKYANG